MKSILFIASVFFSTIGGDPITGRWVTKPSEKGNVTEIMFKAGNIIEGYTNKKNFAIGRYFFNDADSILSFVDNGCNNQTAVYKVQFFSNSDSIRFSLVMDSCIDRRNGIQRLVLGRKK